MIVDSSAIVAIVGREPGFERLGHALKSASSRRISTVNWLETQLVLSGASYRQQADELERLFVHLGLALVSFDAQHMTAAFEAAQRFGRGRHPARLNFGDCMAYATAKLAKEPLLYVGDDFAKTDIESAL